MRARAEAKGRAVRGETKWEKRYRIESESLNAQLREAKNEIEWLRSALAASQSHNYNLSQEVSRLNGVIDARAQRQGRSQQVEAPVRKQFLDAAIAAIELWRELK